MGKRLIQPISDNKDKQRTYVENIEKYSKVMFLKGGYVL